MSQKITATLLRGFTYTFANQKFDVGVEKTVTAEVADKLEEKVFEVTLAETNETEDRPYFRIERTEVAEAAEGEETEDAAKPSGRSRAR